MEADVDGAAGFYGEHFHVCHERAVVVVDVHEHIVHGVHIRRCAVIYVHLLAARVALHLELQHVHSAIFDLDCRRDEPVVGCEVGVGGVATH